MPTDRAKRSTSRKPPARASPPCGPTGSSFKNWLDLNESDAILGLLDQGIRGTEHSSWTVLPDPRMEHPARLVRELAAPGATLCLCQVDSRGVVGQYAHVVMFVPGG